MDLRSEGEKFAMLLITGVTNFVSIPAIVMVYKKGLYFQFCIGFFTFFTSLMYHSLDSVLWPHLYIRAQEWHKLDNIGSIMCFVTLMIYWMDNLQHKENGTYHSKQFCNTDLILNLCGLFLTMIMQANHPWELQNTIIPILIFIAICLFKNICIRPARFNKAYMKRGLIWMGLAVYCFIKGLDEDSDYLRIYHGLWHCGGSISSFYL